MITVHTIPEAFSPTDCDRIVALARTAPPRDAGLVGATTQHAIRRADLVWIDDVAGADWVMDRIIEVIAAANRDAFDVSLREFGESAQIARYGAERAGHFDWHSDIGTGPWAAQRKLTMVVQLSDPAGYEGGQLQVWSSNAVITAPAEKGTATLFPSYLLHRVTPVTAGERHSLTIWAHGPRYR